jgi:phospholipid-binding lipoprotein MlaA
MRLIALITSVVTTMTLTGCAHKGTNPADPYESFNRKIHSFNMSADKAVLKPAAIIYTTVLPGFVRKGINNAFNNIDMVPSVANDILQAEGKWAIKDTWRFAINSTLGVGGLFDVAEKMGLPPHYNDLGLTFAKWGDKNSPYIVIPLLGPSTIRDGSGMLFQFALWSPYVYINNDPLAYGLAALRYVDLRAQLLDSEHLMDEALDKYSFIRDAYLQHRNYQITGASASQNDGDLYVDDGNDKTADAKNNVTRNSDEPSDYVDE